MSNETLIAFLKKQIIQQNQEVLTLRGHVGSLGDEIEIKKKSIIHLQDLQDLDGAQIIERERNVKKYQTIIDILMG